MKVNQFFVDLHLQLTQKDSGFNFIFHGPFSRLIEGSGTIQAYYFLYQTSPIKKFEIMYRSFSLYDQWVHLVSLPYPLSSLITLDHEKILMLAFR